MLQGGICFFDEIGKVPVRSPHKRCARSPWLDVELQDFQGADQAIAGAIKYASKQVIIVSRSDEAISDEVHAYAKSRDVELRRISIDLFEPECLDRMRLIHYVPSPGDTYQPPFPWVERFVPPVGWPVED